MPGQGGRWQLAGFEQRPETGHVENGHAKFGCFGHLRRARFCAEHQCRSLTARGKLARFVKLIAPGRVEDMALAALKDDVRPK